MWNFLKSEYKIYNVRRTTQVWRRKTTDFDYWVKLLIDQEVSANFYTSVPILKFVKLRLLRQKSKLFSDTAAVSNCK